MSSRISAYSGSSGQVVQFVWVGVDVVKLLGGPGLDEACPLLGGELAFVAEPAHRQERRASHGVGRRGQRELVVVVSDVFVAFGSRTARAWAA